MNKFKFFSIAVAMLFFFACGSENQQDENQTGEMKISELKAGDKLDGMTIAEIHSDKDFHVIKFNDEIVVQGTLVFSEDPNMFLVETPIFSADLLAKDDTVKLTNQTLLALVGGIGIKDYLPAAWFEEGTQGWRMKNDEQKKNHSVKVLVKDILYESDNMFPLQATVTQVLLVNGQKAEKQESTPTNNVLNFKSIKKGDQIEGLKVKYVEYQANDHYHIKLEGEFTVSGNIIHNEMYGDYFISLDEASVFKTVIKFDDRDESYTMCESIGFNNPNKFLSAVGEDKLKKARQGQEAPVTITLKNLVVGQNFDKGMLAYGQADFVK